MNDDTQDGIDSTQETDEKLVDLAIAGDRQALETLLRRQQAWIYNLAFYMLHHRQDAEDATQEILVRVATGLSSFRRASAFRTWVHRIAASNGWSSCSARCWKPTM